MKKTVLNHKIIILLVILHQVSGFIWYLPQIFGNPWLSLLGKNIEELDGTDPIPYIISISMSLVISYALAWLIIRLEANTPIKGMTIALICCVAFLLAPTAIHYGFSGTPWGLWLIDNGRELLMWLISGGILAKWPAYKKEKSIRDL